MKHTRFWGKVKKGAVSKCWEWLGYKSKQGYGKFGWGPKVVPAHRVAWIITFGEIPIGKMICHHCDNPPCCNPSHLFLGDAQSNYDDMANKGRRADNKGEKHGMCKLSEADVATIRMLRSSGLELSVIALEYGISEAHVSRICNGMAWSHILGYSMPNKPKKKRKPRRAVSGSDVIEIIRLIQEGLPQAAISKRFMVNQSVVSRINQRKARFSKFI